MTFNKVWQASEIIGSRVVITDAEELGSIKDLMVDLDSGRIAYAVLTFGGILGMGNKLFSLPWDALIHTTDRNDLTLKINKDVLTKAQGFDKDQWPADTQYEAGKLMDIYNYYGYPPYWR